MSAQVHVPSLFARVGTASALTLAVTSSMLAPGLVSDAEAATAHSTKALKVAASKKGAPYKYGAAGPSRFDCSGLTLYSFKKAGKKLPRTAQQQYNKTRHIAKSQRKRGDLVFFHSGRSVYHVGIYAGAGKIWHSPEIGGRGTTGENLVQERLVRTGPLTRRPDALSVRHLPCRVSLQAPPLLRFFAVHRPCHAVTGLSAAAGR
ncbi:NlpC/P60 family protein [Streptomyces sp. Termitarium-T10T-6]|nr:NlpC/P60 family protein [Streptomyces sp. Termitarium-T10T-6]